jgi:hypothetical protein
LVTKKLNRTARSQNRAKAQMAWMDTKSGRLPKTCGLALAIRRTAHASTKRTPEELRVEQERHKAAIREVRRKAERSIPELAIKAVLTNGG